jgi:uncharacterized membrane protein
MTGVTALSWAGMIAMAVPAVMAALRYALADILLADEPGKAVTACIRESKQMMNRRKGMLFSLELSFIFWYLGEMLVSSFLAGLGSGVLSLMFQMLAGLFLSVYMEASVCAFSEAVRKPKQPGKLLWLAFVLLGLAVAVVGFVLWLYLGRGGLV